MSGFDAVPTSLIMKIVEFFWWANDVHRFLGRGFQWRRGFLVQFSAGSFQILGDRERVKMAWQQISDEFIMHQTFPERTKHFKLSCQLKRNNTGIIPNWLFSTFFREGRLKILPDYLPINIHPIGGFLPNICGWYDGRYTCESSSSIKLCSWRQSIDMSTIL